MLKAAFAAFFCLATVAGCATETTVANKAEDAGLSQSFRAPEASVVQAALATLDQMDLETKGVEKSGTGTAITFAKPMSAFSWGEVGRILVSSDGSGGSLVRVASAKRMQTQITGTSTKTFASKIFAGISGNL